MDPTTSILTKPSVDDFLIQAREYIQKNGHLVSLLLLKLVNKERFSIELHKIINANNPGQTRAKMFVFSKWFQQEFGEIEEVATIMVGWGVNRREYSLEYSSLSEPLALQETIYFYGRNAANTKRTIVAQPFTRDKKNQPVWEELLMAEYNQPPVGQLYPKSFLDDMFNDAFTGPSNNSGDIHVIVSD